MYKSQCSVVRSTDQKRKVARKITDTLMEDFGAPAEAITISFVEVGKESWASAGTLILDRTK
jgi:4-oxalocrotonate tautomerase